MRCITKGLITPNSYLLLCTRFLTCPPPTPRGGNEGVCSNEEGVCLCVSTALRSLPRRRAAGLGVITAPGLSGGSWGSVHSTARNERRIPLTPTAHRHAAAPSQTATTRRGLLISAPADYVKRRRLPSGESTTFLGNSSFLVYRYLFFQYFFFLTNIFLFF